MEIKSFNIHVIPIPNLLGAIDLTKDERCSKVCTKKGETNQLKVLEKSFKRILSAYTFILPTL